MSSAGPLNKRVSFQRRDTATDEYGNVSTGTWSEINVVWGGLNETAGRERIDGAALEAPMTGLLTVRSSSLTRAVREADSAFIGGVRWNIRSIRNPDRRNRFLEMVIEREVAV
jgi:head-tail adaptor